ncbi:hypothetical protein [Vulcanisaeta sp. JCM 14467]|uniref:hypothetical protein n=1 Tax=Vulcanisaeta sp. JCM 14467 TaxID=1295370 RepID=UPI0006D1C4C8|nr:hypothetical protein [Vulcanisaeta sp. JCM 14467]
MIRIGNLRPIDYLLIALAYGLGTRYMDRYGADEYMVNCEVVNYEIRCMANCGGSEDRCLVYRLLTRGGLTLRCLTRS